MRRSSLATLVLAVATVGTAGWLLAGSREAAAVSGASEEVVSPARLLPVEVQEVQPQGQYAVDETHAGRVVARRSSDLGFERSGRLEAVRFDQGDAVPAGAELARLDSRELRARRRELVARRSDIEAQLALARVTTERRRKLHDAGHLAPQRLDETVYAQQGLEAQLSAARAAIENVDVQIDLSVIRAPYAGSIADRWADEGTVISPGQPILRILEDRALEVHIGVPPDTAAGLETGSVHRVEVADTEVPAVLDSVLRTVEPDTRTVRVVFRLEDPPAQVRSGALGRVTLASTVSAPGYWLPITALAEGRRGLWTAYVVEDDGNGTLRVARRQLEMVHAEADRAFVRGTLRPGDRVVTSGVHRLVPGQPVRLATPEPRRDGRPLAATPNGHS